MKRLIILFAFTLSLALLLFMGCGASCSDGDKKADSGQSTTDERDEDKTQTPDGGESGDYEREEITQMFIYANGNKLEVTLAENSSVDALLKLLKDGDITFTASRNGSFEIYGDIGHWLPADDTWISGQSGDVLLYASKYICLFFGENGYDYTRIGKINGYSASELRDLLGADGGSVQVTLSLK